MSEWDGRILQFWANRLRVDASALLRTGLTFRVNEEREDRLIVYTRGDARVVTVPKQVERSLTDDLRGEAFTVEGVAARAQRSIQPKWRDFIYYATAPFTSPFAADQVRVLTARDKPLLEAMQAQCAPEELEAAEISIDDPLVVGYVEGDKLIGAASLLSLGSDIFDIGVLTLSACRGRSIGAALTAYLRNHVTAQGNVAQYMTWEENRASIRVAEKCAFQLFITEEGYEIA